jgi:hypothetical protein
MSLSSAELQKLGLKYVGFGESHQTCSSDLSTRRFRAHYGVDSLAVKALIAVWRHEERKLIQRNCSWPFVGSNCMSWRRLWQVDGTTERNIAEIHFKHTWNTSEN